MPIGLNKIYSIFFCTDLYYKVVEMLDMYFFRCLDNLYLKKNTIDEYLRLNVWIKAFVYLINKKVHFSESILYWGN